MLALFVALLAAAPAQGRKHRLHAPPGPPPARAEDDPRKKGDSPAFARARISFALPQDLGQLEAGPVRIALEVKGYALGALKPGGPSPHAHLIVDNLPAFEIRDVSRPLRVTGLTPGPHLVRAVLCRPWHELVKAPHAFALARFWLGPRLLGKAGKAAEYVAWPDPRKPVLTYVLPVGVVHDQLQVEREVEAETFAPIEDPTPGGDRPVLDFYLSRGKLARRGDKLRVVLDRRELPLVTEWKPQHLRRASHGRHVLTIDLLNRKGLQVRNAVNRTDRAFVVEASRQPVAGGR